MKKVLVIGGLSTERDQTKYGKFFSEFIGNYDFDVANLDELSFSIAPDNFSIKATKLDKEIKDYDLIIFRGKLLNHRELAYVISVYLKHHKKPFFNDYSVYRSSNKLAQTAFFYEQKIPFIKTCFALRPEDLSQLVEKSMHLPVVIKDAWGAHGENNLLVKTGEDLDKILTDNPTVEFIAQPYQPNSCDYRVLIMGDQEPLVIKRTASEGTHLNNTSRGAKAELIHDFPRHLITLAKDLARNSGAVIAGVDILPNSETGEYFVLEINSQPQILTGAFVDEKHAAIKDLLDSYLN